MKTIIAGPHEIEAPLARILVMEAIESCEWKDSITEIVHGCARGIDSAAADVCKDRWPIKGVEANWAKYSRSAGPIRNSEMAKYADALIAVSNGISPGTADMIKKAKKAGLKIHILEIDPPKFKVT